MREAPESEPDSLDALDQVVDLGRAVAHQGLVPRHDLIPPTHDGAAERADLGRARLVLEIDAKLVDEFAGELGGTDLIDRSGELAILSRRDLYRVPSWR